MGRGGGGCERVDEGAQDAGEEVLGEEGGVGVEGEEGQAGGEVGEDDEGGEGEEVEGIEGGRVGMSDCSKSMEERREDSVECAWR